MEGKINNVRNDLVDDILKQITNAITNIPEDIDNLRNVYLHIDVQIKSRQRLRIIFSLELPFEQFDPKMQNLFMKLIGKARWSRIFLTPS